MPYIYTGKHTMYHGAKVPVGALIENPEHNRLLGAYNLRALLDAGVAKEIGDTEANKIRAAFKKQAENTMAARNPKAPKESFDSKTKPPGGDK